MHSVVGLRDSCSDTDSGICADSDGQLSPKRLDKNIQSKFRIMPPAYPLLYPPKSGSTLPRRPQQQLHRKVPALPVKNSCKKPLKVRFADQSDVKLEIPEKPYYYCIDSQPLPYDEACRRIMQLRGSRTRSKSLGRLNDPSFCDEMAYAEMVRRSTDNYVKVLSAAKSVDNLAISTEKTVLKGAGLKNGYKHPCVMPSGSCDDIVHLGSEVVRQERKNQKSRSILPPPVPQKPLKQKKFANHGIKKSHSEHIVRLVDEPSVVKTDRSIQPLPSFYTQDRLHGLQSHRQVKVRLLGLDHRGIHSIELEKFDSGPFGFFIATGMYKHKKGIYVSRVSLTCLASLLSVGDQILSVDGQSTKGKSLEQCQQLISNKNKIVLNILPVIMR